MATKIIERRSTRFIISHGIVAGLISGTVYMLYQMLVGASMGFGSSFYPATLASLIVGSGALSPTYDVSTAIVLGWTVRLLLSMVYGVVFFYSLTYFRQTCSAPRTLMLYGVAYGTGLWIMNHIIVGTALFPQLLVLHPMWMGFVPHAIFVGLVLGAYVAAVRFGKVGDYDLPYKACYVRST
jgi:hypothetical protein